MLTRYIEAAMAQAQYTQLEDGTFVGKIPPCPGVIAFAETRPQCQMELRSVLEDWVLLGLQAGDPLPVIDGIDLNRKPAHEPVEPL